MLVDANLSTEQAVAVFELLDDLREQVLGHYSTLIQEYYRGNRVPVGRSLDSEHDGEPF